MLSILGNAQRLQSAGSKDPVADLMQWVNWANGVRSSPNPAVTPTPGDPLAGLPGGGPANRPVQPTPPDPLAGLPGGGPANRPPIPPQPPPMDIRKLTGFGDTSHLNIAGTPGLDRWFQDLIMPATRVAGTDFSPDWAWALLKSILDSRYGGR